MPSPSRQNEIINTQNGTGEWLRQVPRLPRLIFGSAACAAMAFYIPLSLILLTGSWGNVPTLWIANLICVAVLAVQNFVAHKTGKGLTIGLLLALIFDCYVISLTVRTYMFSEWRFWWQNFFFVTTVFPLNAFLFSKYEQASEF